MLNLFLKKLFFSENRFIKIVSCGPTYRRFFVCCNVAYMNIIRKWKISVLCFCRAYVHDFLLIHSIIPRLSQSAIYWTARQDATKSSFFKKLASKLHSHSSFYLLFLILKSNSTVHSCLQLWWFN